MQKTWRGYGIEIKKLKVDVPEGFGGPIREFIAVIACPDGRIVSNRNNPETDPDSALVWARDWIDCQEDVVKPKESP